MCLQQEFKSPSNVCAFIKSDIQNLVKLFVRLTRNLNLLYGFPDWFRFTDCSKVGPRFSELTVIQKVLTHDPGGVDVFVPKLLDASWKILNPADSWSFRDQADVRPRGFLRQGRNPGPHQHFVALNA